MLLQASKGDEEFQGRDLLTLLLKSNIATKANGNQKMSDEELFGREYKYYFTNSPSYTFLFSRDRNFLLRWARDH